MEPDMNIWKHRRLIGMAAFDLLVVIAVLFANRIGGLVGAPTETLDSVVNAGEQARDPHVGLVFMLTTGFEDLREVELCLSDVKMAKASGDLADVTLIVRGRGVDALTNSNGRPAQIARLVHELKASGVHIIASDSELAQDGLSSAHMDPAPNELVPDAATRMIEFVSLGYQVIRY
jgi:intracellular sulfur oxidation DsrE/DsrF family protein